MSGAARGFWDLIRTRAGFTFGLTILRLELDRSSKVARSLALSSWDCDPGVILTDSSGKQWAPCKIRRL